MCFTAMYELFDEQIRQLVAIMLLQWTGRERAADLANEQEKLGEQLVPIKMKWIQLIQPS